MITGGRTDFRLPSKPCQILNNDKRIKLTVIATGSYLGDVHGYTLNESHSFSYTNVETIDLSLIVLAP